MAKHILLLVSIFMLAGCSTTAPKPGTEKSVPTENIFALELLQHKEGNESVKFVRDAGILGAACLHTISVDGEKAFALRPQESITISLPPGEHLFLLETGRGSCPNEAHSEDTNLVLGKPQTYRVSVSSNFNLLFTRIQ